MIQKVSFRNFKAYRSLDLDLEPLTVLVGPNASGKTTLLQGLHLATRLAAGERGLFEDAERIELKSYGSDSSTELSFSGLWGGTAGAVRTTFDFTLNYAAVDGEWGGASFHDKIGLVRPRRAAHGMMVGMGDGLNPPTTNGLVAFQRVLMSTAMLRFEAQTLADAYYSEEPIPSIGPGGEGLASLLAHLKLSEDEVFDAIELSLKQIIPSVRRIRIERASVEQTMLRTLSLDEQRHQIPEQRTLWGNKIVLDMKGAKGVAADSAGEGTLMALGLLTVLMGPNKPRLLLLDDIELNLHPVAQGKLIETLRKLQERDPELQIVATSHSPFILNYLKPEEVRMVFPSDNGFARCEKLTAHPEFDRWKDLMSPGEFWSTVGESWVGKVPAKS